MTPQTASIPTASHAGSSGPAAQVNSSHAVGAFLGRLVSAPATSRIAMAVGELAASCDGASRGASVAVAISAVESDVKIGETSVALAALWGRWGRPTVLVDLGSGANSLGGAVTGSSPDLAAACEAACSGASLDSLSRLHSSIAATGVIAAGKADVLGLISTGRVANLVAALKKTHDRVVLAAPRIATGFPLLALNNCCDRIVLALVRGKSRGGPVREIAEQALQSGMRPIDVIWYD